MEFNKPSEIVKTLTFGGQANEEIMQGVKKLSNAVINFPMQPPPLYHSVGKTGISVESPSIASLPVARLYCLIRI